MKIVCAGKILGDELFASHLRMDGDRGAKTRSTVGRTPLRDSSTTVLQPLLTHVGLSERICSSSEPAAGLVCKRVPVPQAPGAARWWPIPPGPCGHATPTSSSGSCAAHDASEGTSGSGNTENACMPNIFFYKLDLE